MLHFKLGTKRLVSDEDPMKRDWVGYDPTVPAEELFERNRGIWSLGRRATREEYALFSSTHDKKVKFVVRIGGEFEQHGRKQALTGEVLPLDHPVSEEWVGKPAPDRFRNPVTYVPSTRTCACGCGETVIGASVFAPGHDQRAIHERIARKWGTTLDFIEWFDNEYPDLAPGADGDARGA